MVISQKNIRKKTFYIVAQNVALRYTSKPPHLIIETSKRKSRHSTNGIMHWLMACSYVTCTPRNVTVTSLHTSQVIQTVLFQKSQCKLVTDVMILTGEVAALQHQRHVD